jgi:predicted DNA-binding transcriptional regulator YafY
MLTTKESEALIAAIRLLKTWGGEALSQSLESAQEKMLAILPEEPAPGGADPPVCPGSRRPSLCQNLL